MHGENDAYWASGDRERHPRINFSVPPVPVPLSFSSSCVKGAIQGVGLQEVTELSSSAEGKTVTIYYY